MSHPSNDLDRGPSQRILASALTSFAQKGYHATSARDIATGAGLSVPGVYHHYKSKQDVLMALMMAVMGELLSRTRAALDQVRDAEPSTQFDALVEALLRFHLERREEAFVASSEIRSLDPGNRDQYVALRDEQQQMIVRVVRDGRETGAFEVPEVDEAARAVATLCVGVATWYRPEGPLTAEELIRRQLKLARRVVGHPNTV